MSAPREISDLVDRFAEHADAYRSGAYNETQVRREFVDPMFKALGWDMENVSGYAEAYKDVIHEDAIKPGQRVLAVDDLLATGGTMGATLRLIRQLGGQVVGVAFMIELAFLHGRDKLKEQSLHSLIVYE